jgi:hypothetical protein
MIMMIEKLVRWLLNRVEAETQQKMYVKKIYVLAELLHGTYDFIDNDDALVQQLYIIAYNTRYKHIADEMDDTPHNTMMRYRKMAANKKYDYFEEPFYAEMKRQKDKELIKLRAIINRLRK